MQAFTEPAVAPPVEQREMVIGGEFVPAVSGRRLDVIDPAQGSTIATVASAGPEDVSRAVDAAERALEAPRGWSSLSAGQRGRRLLRLSSLIEAHRDELAEIESRNVGRPISAARGDMETVAAVFAYYGGAADKLLGETIPVSQGGLDLTLREPIGVVGLIVPWNYPAVMAAWKLGPALVVGNAVVLKPASYTPLTALRLAELALEADIPPGVFNVVTGPGETTGSALVAHPAVGKIAFTGETSTGQQIMQLAAATTKRVSLELGGKSANIVFGDADLERFAAESVWAAFDNSGQDCTARTRILVERSAHDRVVELFVDAACRLKVGVPSDPTSEIGPLVSARQRDRVLEYIAAGQAEGAHLQLGGASPQGPEFANGAYVVPTIFDQVDPRSQIAREEIFGPVVAILAFDAEDEAIRLANATPYGLSGSVWSRDIGRALRTARGVRSGVVSVNSNASVHIEAPFGGYKMSGFGRELGMHALELYTEVKNVYIELS